MADMDSFTLIDPSSSRHNVFDDYVELHNGHAFDPLTSYTEFLKRHYPELTVTVTSANNVNLLRFAAFGNATAELDIKDESIQRFRYFFPGNDRRGVPDQLTEARTFAKYIYVWGTEYFIVYIIQVGYTVMQYILKEPGKQESTLSTNSVTDKLIAMVGAWQKPDDKFIYVYDSYWYASRPLYNEIKHASWDDVILNDDMKKALTELMHKFFDSKDIYKDLGVPWKRGCIFHGPAGNGKTISIKALMASLFQKYGFDVPSLYVKSAPRTWDIRSIFSFARTMAPCLLVLEDIDTIVTYGSRSYFFNEVDGLENNDGIFMVASTNHLDQLDPGLSSRPSRFDRKYLFPLPSEEERAMYCEYWRNKLKNKPSIKFPKKLCAAIASITDDFSFAYLKEAFVSTLLSIAGRRSEEGGGSDDDGGDLDDYELWREMKKQVKLLRDDMGTKRAASKIEHANLATIDDAKLDLTKLDLSWKDHDKTSIVSSPKSELPLDDGFFNRHFELAFRSEGYRQHPGPAVTDPSKAVHSGAVRPSAGTFASLQERADALRAADVLF